MLLIPFLTSIRPCVLAPAVAGSNKRIAHEITNRQSKKASIDFLSLLNCDWVCSFLSSLSRYEAAPKQKEREKEKRRDSLLKRRSSGKTIKWHILCDFRIFQCQWRRRYAQALEEEIYRWWWWIECRDEGSQKINKIRDRKEGEEENQEEA